MAKSKIKKGRLRIYLGYATGCGKSFTLLKDAITSKQRGTRIAIGALGHIDRTGICDMAGEFPRIGAESTGLDVELIKNSPYDLILIDDLAMTNPPGSKHKKRFEDVLEVVQSGKDVFTTLNVQHLDSVSERLRESLSVRIQERVPDLLLNEAESIVFVDLPIEELRDRIASEQVFPKDKAEQALFHFFTHENLGLLRKFALETIVEDQLRRILTEKLLGSHAREEADPSVLVILTGRDDDEDLFNKMIHKGAKYASTYSSHCYVVLANPKKLLGVKQPETAAPLRGRLQKLSEGLGASFQEVKGSGVAEQVVEFCNSHNIRHLIVPKDDVASFIQKVMNHTPGVDVHLIDRPSAKGER
jgi:two-component system sensor histidine kinase KdpD